MRILSILICAFLIGLSSGRPVKQEGMVCSVLNENNFVNFADPEPKKEPTWTQKYFEGRTRVSYWGGQSWRYGSSNNRRSAK